MHIDNPRLEGKSMSRTLCLFSKLWHLCAFAAWPEQPTVQRCLLNTFLFPSAWKYLTMVHHGKIVIGSSLRQLKCIDRQQASHECKKRVHHGPTIVVFTKVIYIFDLANAVVPHNLMFLNYKLFKTFGTSLEVATSCLPALYVLLQELSAHLNT